MSLNKLKKNYDKLKNNYKKLLDLGWCQGYMALQYHMEEAILEKYNIGPAPKLLSFHINIIMKFNKLKIIKFMTFVGSVQLNHQKNIDYG